MKLFIFVLNQPEKLPEVLAAYVEIGIPGATILDTVGMGQILSSGHPVFAGFRSLMRGSRSANKTIVAVVDDDAKVAEAIRILEEICGSFDDPGVSIAFAVPVDSVKGLRAEPG